ncbi:MAG: AbrB/MazE/SpoVT family DNA-binding domain-containing protein [Bacteroidetes bacterium]|nr:AbrB/MazE/SpoVT family DNA-binding domain-containing protein [Bacteroidota bacterium]
MRGKIQKWGNSHAIRIPAAFVKEANVAYGTSVDISVEDGRIVIAPDPWADYRLDDLLDGITDENLHAEIDTGKAVGREAW